MGIIESYISSFSFLERTIETILKALLERHFATIFCLSLENIIQPVFSTYLSLKTKNQD